MLSVVIPAFNEEDRLPRCLSNTIKFLNKQDYESEIIVVCDGCTDSSANEVLKLTPQFSNLRLIQYAPNRGKGHAVKEGMLEARGNLRLFMDADYAVPVELIGDFISQLADGYDVVIGARDLKESEIVRHQWFLRELAGKIFGRIQKFILEIPYYDTQCGFKLFTGDAAEFLFSKLKYECSYFDAEMIYIAHRAGLKIKEMPVVWAHDGITRMPVGPGRTIDLFVKLLKLKRLHSEIQPYSNERIQRSR